MTSKQLEGRLFMEIIHNDTENKVKIIETSSQAKININKKFDSLYVEFRQIFHVFYKHSNPYDSYRPDENISLRRIKNEMNSKSSTLYMWNSIKRFIDSTSIRTLMTCIGNTLK